MVFGNYLCVLRVLHYVVVLDVDNRETILYNDFSISMYEYFCW